MIQGIERFKDYFNDYSDNYIIIGGLATALLMDNYGFLARATKDIDMVIICKENNEDFLKKLLQFIKIAGYTTKQKTINTSKRNLFRFLNSDNKEYPEQIELFAVHAEDSILSKAEYIIPIETPEFYNYLSAILLDTHYYGLLASHTTFIDGLHIATAEVLIPLKIHAHLNLKDSGLPYDDKHLKDVIKLSALLNEDEEIKLTGRPKDDFDEFMALLEMVEPQRVSQILKGMQAGGLHKEDIVNILQKVFS